MFSLTVEQLQKQLGEEKEKRRSLEDKLELMRIWASNPLDPVKICKLIISPEDWDGDIWEDPHQELSDEGESDESEFKVAPIIKTEISVGPQGAAIKTMGPPSTDQSTQKIWAEAWRK